MEEAYWIWQRICSFWSI